MQVAAAEAVDGAAELAAAAVERGRHLGVERRCGAGRVGAVEDDDRVDVPERGGDRRCREGPERDELEQPDRLAGFAQLVDHVLHGSRRRPECDDRGRRAVEPVLLDLAVAIVRISSANSAARSTKTAAAASIAAACWRRNSK